MNYQNRNRTVANRCGLNQFMKACNGNIIDKYDIPVGLLDKIMIYMQRIGAIYENHLLIDQDKITSRAKYCAERDNLDYVILRVNTTKDCQYRAGMFMWS